MTPATTEDEFVALWDRLKSPTAIAKHLGISVRSVMNRRRRIEGARKIVLQASLNRSGAYYQYLEGVRASAEKRMEVEDGCVVIFSDAHFWPGVRTTAFRGLLRMIEELKPVAVVNNGDSVDGASVSRHPPIGWGHVPSVKEELKACGDALGEIEERAKGARLYWPLGNHDKRFETFLASHAPQYEGVQGFRLKDQFPAWEPCWSLWVNEKTVIKHRWKGGVHATHNNTVNSGATIVTGHLHSLKVTPFNDYFETRWGVDSGMLADVGGPQFVDYTEANPTNWRSGFIVLTYRNGRLMWPEIVRVWDFDHIEWRGQIIDVSQE